MISSFIFFVYYLLLLYYIISSISVSDILIYNIKKYILLFYINIFCKYIYLIKKLCITINHSEIYVFVVVIIIIFFFNVYINIIS